MKYTSGLSFRTAFNNLTKSKNNLLRGSSKFNFHNVKVRYSNELSSHRQYAQYLANLPY